MKEIDKFIDFIRYEKRYSINTVLAYQKDLEQFSVFLESQFDIKHPDDISSSMIRSWLMSMMEDEMSARSVNRKITTLKSFYKFLIKQDLTSKNPMLKVTSPKTPKRLPVFVEGEKMDFLLDSNIFDDSFIGQRDRLIIELFYATGMRLAELHQLKINDVNLHLCQVRVLGKRNKERIIPVVQSVIDLLKNYLNLRSEIPNTGEHLFVLENGEPIYRVLIYRIVRKYLTSVSSQDKKSPHVLRHSFATEMLNRGADLNAIKEILGHASLAATQVYTHNTIEKLKEAYKQAHPRA
jgi:integrase/recombinase XerC